MRTLIKPARYDGNIITDQTCWYIPGISRDIPGTIVRPYAAAKGLFSRLLLSYGMTGSLGSPLI